MSEEEKRKQRQEEFIRKAKEKHGDKYDYSKVDYKDSRTKVCIICPIHGEFKQNPVDHLRGKGCSKCSGCYSPTTDEFIEKAKRIHGDKYNYSKVEYKGSHTKVCIICLEHGEFWQLPTNHLQGNGCPGCSGKGKLTTEDFIKKAQEIHGNKYDYSKTVYKNMHTKICIRCPEHGEFWQSPYNHLKSKECCPKRNRKTAISEKFEFIKKAKEIQCEDKKDYSKVCNICPIRGELEQSPKGRISGKEYLKREKGRLKLTTEDFIKKARKKYGDKYDYSKVDYIDSNTEVIIICPTHGEFKQTPRYHLHRGTCPNCVRDKYKKKPKDISKKRKNYTKEDIFELGQNYETKSDFARANPSAYHASLRNNWLDEMTHWQIPKRHKPIMSIPNNLVYCYEFPNKVVYVGRTNNMKKRDHEHKRNHHHSNGKITKGTVLKYSEKTGISIPSPKILKDNLTLLQSREEEDNFCKKYENNGYTLLNIAKTGKYSGSLGACLLYDNYEQILDTAKKYSTKLEFIKNSGGMYSAVRRMGLWPQLIKDANWKKHALEKTIYVYYSNDMKLFGSFSSITDTIKATGVSKYRIFGVINKKVKDADGFIFSFHKLS